MGAKSNSSTYRSRELSSCSWASRRVRFWISSSIWWTRSSCRRRSDWVSEVRSELSSCAWVATLFPSSSPLPSTLTVDLFAVQQEQQLGPVLASSQPRPVSTPIADREPPEGGALTKRPLQRGSQARVGQLPRA